MTDDRDFGPLEAFLKRLASAPAKRRSRVAADAPLESVKEAALHHPDPFVRRDCLWFLDHYANEGSAEVFGLALGDPVEPVRNAALHSIACESCRTEDLCAVDVVPRLVDVLVTDPSVELRHKTIPVLLRLADRDPRARAAVVRASREDADDLLRDVATRALAGEHVRARKTYEHRSHAKHV